MAQVTPNMSLYVWNLITDLYDHEQLADNFIRIDRHDHSTIGAQINGSTGIMRGTIGSMQLAPNSVNSNAIAPEAVTSDAIGKGQVTSSKIEDSISPTTGVTSGKIADDAIVTSKILDGQVTRSKIDPGVFPDIISTTLPSDPLDKDEVYYLADSTNSVIWHLRYREAASRWEFIGGPPKYTISGSSLSLSTSNVWTNIKNTQLRLPAGKYIIEINTKYNATYSKGVDLAAISFGFALSGNNPGTVSSIPTTQYCVAEFASPAENTNQQGILNYKSIYTTTISTGVLNLFGYKTTNTNSAIFTGTAITATPLYLSK